MTDDELRSLGPLGLSPERHAVLRERIMAEVNSGLVEPGPVSVEGRRGRSWSRRRRRGIAAGVVVAGVLAAGSAAAAIRSAAGPDPREVAVVMEAGQEVAMVHVPGWRPELQAERVNCVAVHPQDSTTVDFGGFASSFPLEDALGAPQMQEACVSRSSMFGASPVVSDPAVCVAADSSFPVPIVELKAETCSVASGQRELTDEDLDVINSARRMEVGLLAQPFECATQQQTRQWIEERLAAGDVPLTLVDPVVGSGGLVPSTVTTVVGTLEPCYRAFVSWPSASVYADVYKH